MEDPCLVMWTMGDGRPLYRWAAHSFPTMVSNMVPEQDIPFEAKYEMSEELVKILSLFSDSPVTASAVFVPHIAPVSLGTALVMYSIALVVFGVPWCALHGGKGKD